MVKNEGIADRVVRVVIAVAAVLGAVAAGASKPVGIVLLVVAGIMALTAAVGFCPLYRLFGVNTCPINTKES